MKVRHEISLNYKRRNALINKPDCNKFSDYVEKAKILVSKCELENLIHMNTVFILVGFCIVSFNNFF